MQFPKMSVVRSYRDLVVWRKAMALVTDVYRCTQSFPRAETYGLSTQSFPRAETYGLSAQLRRAAISVPSNMAEGQGRASTGEFKQFLGHARGSLLEIETQILIAQNLQYIQPEHGERLLRDSAEIGRILNGLMTSLQRNR